MRKFKPLNKHVDFCQRDSCTLVYLLKCENKYGFNEFKTTTFFKSVFSLLVFYPTLFAQTLKHAAPGKNVSPNKFNRCDFHNLGCYICIPVVKSLFVIYSNVFSR